MSSEQAGTRGMEDRRTMDADGNSRGDIPMVRVCGGEEKAETERVHCGASNAADVFVSCLCTDPARVFGQAAVLTDRVENFSLLEDEVCAEVFEFLVSSSCVVGWAQTSFGEGYKAMAQKGFGRFIGWVEPYCCQNPA